MSPGRGGNRRPRRDFAPLPAGTAVIRITADHELTREYLEKLLLDDPVVRVVKGPDRYEGGRCYATVQVMPFAEGSAEE